MKTSEKGINLIKEFEGCKLYAYYCPAGVLTIGYGHTSDVYEGMTITAEQAEKYLKSDLVWCEQILNAWNFHYNWTQGEYDALISFIFNCGEGEFNRLIRNGDRDKDTIAKKLLLYTHDINGVELAGLVRRRHAEYDLFTSDYSADGSGTEKEYNTVMDIVRGIWAGDFGTPWSESPLLYEYFQKKVNEYKGV